MKNRILVIEDDRPTLDAIKLIFELEDYEVIGRDDCSELDTLLDNFRPNIILMDVIIGSVDGRDICRELKLSRHKNIPLMLMSVVNGFESDSARPMYSDDYIEKPFDLDIMLEKVSSLLQKSKLNMADTLGILN